jgi:hypothetical protein
MELFDQLNLYLHTHPVMLDQLELAFRIKYWALLALAFYFILLPFRHSKKKSARKLDNDQFLP